MSEVLKGVRMSGFAEGFHGPGKSSGIIRKPIKDLNHSYKKKRTP